MTIDARSAHTPTRPSRGRHRIAVAVAAVGLLSLGLPSLSPAANDPSQFGVSSFTTSVLDASGAEETRAGAHPFTASADFEFNTRAGYGEETPVTPVEDPKTIITDLPPGFVGNPRATSVRCATWQLNRVECPVESQVGIATVRYIGGQDGLTPVGVYNMVPSRGNPAEFGFKAGNLGGFGIVQVIPRVRSEGDYGLSITVPYSSQAFVVAGSLTFWGVPADPAHDPDRIVCSFGGFFCNGGTPSTDPLKPFLANPATECTDKQPITTLSVDSWQQPGVFKSYVAASPLITGCDDLKFEPVVSIEPRTTSPDAATGLNVNLAFPQNDDPNGLATPALKRAVVTMPEGMTINPAGANGLAACSDADLKLKSRADVTCPNAAKVGTVTATTPVLEETLTGGVYIRSQNSDDPESGEMFRLALVLENKERGISVRLPGQIRANKDTGRLVTTFDNNPELPVSNIKIDFKDGATAPLVTPPTCGPKTIETTLRSWGGQEVTRQSSFNVDCVPGLGGFLPSFSAGSVNPVAGASSPFTLNVQKPDGHADLNGLRLEMPEGLLATIKGNLGTRVGTATVAAGPGSSPFYLSGPVVLEGAYGDAPYSLRVTVPAKAGPFDLGDVVVRQKVYVDPNDAHVTVVSDPLPTIVKGVPVRLQKLDVAVDKPGFMRNPTSCAQKQVSGTLAAVGGQTAAVSSRFQVGGCDKLPFKPTLKMEMTDPKATTQGKTTPFVATVKQNGGQAGIKKAVVTLPPTLALMTKNAKELCTPAQAAARACPEGSIVGSASAVTPLLDETLTGPVYFVEGTRTTATGRVVPTLPKLWVALRGPIAVDLWADTDVANDRLVNTFAFVPDAPISTFELKINGGKNGILAVSSKDRKADVCGADQRADAVIGGQNGKQRRWRPRVSTPCGFKVIGTTFYSTKAKVRVGGIGKGRLTVSGPGIHRTSRKIGSSTVATVSPRLTVAGKRAYRQRKGMGVRVSFRPAAKGAKAKNARATLKRAKPKAKSASRAVAGPR